MNTGYGQAHSNPTTNLPHRNARAQHLDMAKCWDVANFCPLVVFVGGVRSQCPCSGVNLAQKRTATAERQPRHNFT